MVRRRLRPISTKRKGRGSGSGPVESSHDRGTADGVAGGDSAVTGADPGDRPSADAPEPTGPDVDDAELADPAGEVGEHIAARPVTGLRLALAASLLTVAILGGLVSYLGYHGYQTRVADRQRELFLAVGRQAAINLTTISYTEAEADVSRILDSATGTFRDEFQQRSAPFIDVVKRAQSTSQGNVTAAGLESVDGDQAQVIVAVSVKTANAGVPEQQPRGWRMRLAIQKVGDTAKVSDVQFVP